jgi:hypothetical protein
VALAVRSGRAHASYCNGTYNYKAHRTPNTRYSALAIWRTSAPRTREEYLYVYVTSTYMDRTGYAIKTNNNPIRVCTLSIQSNSILRSDSPRRYSVCTLTTKVVLSRTV